MTPSSSRLRRSAVRSGLRLVALLLSAGPLVVACSTDEPGSAREDGSGGEAGTAGDTVAPETAGAAPSAGAAGAGSSNDTGGGGALGGGEAAGGAGGAGTSSEAPYAVRVVSFVAGSHAGFNADKLPNIVLGPPVGKGTEAGSLDVLSLGAGGEIVLGFGDQTIIDGPGPDFVVFENPFWPGGDASRVFAELAEVSVSEDGSTWHVFDCDTQGSGDGRFPGCAGWSPTLVYDPDRLVPLNPDKTGGDAFDLAVLGLERARFVKIRDLMTQPGAGTTAGFDLDAVGLVHTD